MPMPKTQCVADLDRAHAQQSLVLQIGPRADLTWLDLRHAIRRPKFTFRSRKASIAAESRQRDIRDRRIIFANRERHFSERQPNPQQNISQSADRSEKCTETQK